MSFPGTNLSPTVLSLGWFGQVCSSPLQRAFTLPEGGYYKPSFVRSSIGNITLIVTTCQPHWELVLSVRPPAEDDLFDEWGRG